MIGIVQFAFLLHLIIETAASINFLLRPSATLLVPQPHSHGVIRQYALLLISSNIIAAVMLNREVDSTSGKVAGALGVYHFGPVVRAVSRIVQRSSGSGLNEPWLHAFAHMLCGTCLLVSFIASST